LKAFVASVAYSVLLALNFNRVYPRRREAMPRGGCECKRVKICQARRGGVARHRLPDCAMCNTFIVDPYIGCCNIGEGCEARRQETRSRFFTREGYSPARTNQCIINSNKYSSLKENKNYGSYIINNKKTSSRPSRNSIFITNIG